MNNPENLATGSHQKAYAFFVAASQAFSFIPGLSGMLLLAPAAHAFTLTSGIETSSTTVGAGWSTVTFENSYTNPVAVCTNILASTTHPPVVVRMRSLSSGSMQLRLQEFYNQATAIPATVNCLIAETGVHTLPDGTVLEARSITSTGTHGKSAPNNWAIGSMNNMSSSFTGSFTSPIALGQVMTYNDSDASVFHANDCENRGNPAFLSGFADGICVTKHIGETSGARNNETIGVIAIERGTSSYDGIAFRAQRGNDSIAGVGNSPPYSYGTGSTYEFGVATQAAEDGGDGGWAVLYGNNPLAGSSIDLAIDEEDTEGDTSRAHTTENVNYFVVRRLPLFTVEKTVDPTAIAEPKTLNYTITLVNTGELNQTGISLIDTLPDGSTGTVSGPTETGGTITGTFEPAETWTYTVSYNATLADVAAGNDLVNNVSVTTAQYAAEGLLNETDTAITTIAPPNPSLTVTKVADDTMDVIVGQTLTYTYTVTNTGNQTLTNVFATDVHQGFGPDPSPANETLLTDAAPTGDSIDATSNDGVWDSLAPGDTITYTATYVVTQSDVDTLQ